MLHHKHKRSHNHQRHQLHHQLPPRLQSRPGLQRCCRKQMLERDVARVKAVLARHFGYVFGVREFDIHALFISFPSTPGQKNNGKHTLYKAAPCFAANTT